MPARMLVVWCPDWPLMAAGVAAATPAAVVHANRVVACTPAARLDGVGPGLRRREAQGRCPGLELLDHDQGRDAAAFEPVAAALEALAPKVEVVRPGVLAVASKGASRYHGGDAALAALAAAAVDAVLGERGRCQVGLAEGRFAAELAARRAAIVPPGATGGFLRPLPIAALDDPELAGLLARLGIATLGDLADLAPSVVGARFGPAGTRAQRLARGHDEQPLTPRRPPPDLAVAAPIEPPAEQVSTAAFVARALATELRAKLDGLGLVCTRVRIEAETEHGELLVRVWRSDVAGSGQAGGFDAAAIAERVRWQLDGWLAAPAASRPTGGIALLRLVPDELAGAQGRQLGFWGGDGQADERAMRALARVQGLLGHDAVVMPVLRGGRGPGERVAHVPPLGAEPPVEPGTAPGAREPVPSSPPPPEAGRAPSPRGMVAFARAIHPAGRGRRRLAGGGPGTPSGAAAPWPGRVPAPGPALVHARPLTAELLDDEGAVVSVTGRGELGPDCGPPARLWVGGLGRGRVPAWATVAAWAGPWTAQERWWARRPTAGPAARRDRFQVLTADGHAYLLALVDGAWWVEATYD